MSASSRLRRGAPRFLFCLFCAAGATSCNAIFGIQDGQLTGGGGPGGSGATGGGGTGTQGGGGATGGNDTTGGGGTTTTGTGPCAAFPTPDGQDTVWAKQATGTFEDRGIAIGWQPGGGVIVAGAYDSDDFKVGSNVLPHPTHADGPGEGYNLFVARYDGDGKPDWSVGFEGRERQMPFSLDVDGAGAAVVGGYLWNEMKVGAETFTVNKQYAEDSMDGFVIKLDAAGGVEWARQLGGDSTEQVMSVAFDSQGNVVVLGVAYFTAAAPAPASVPADFGCGPRDLELDTQTVFLTKLSPAGECVWDRQYEVQTRFLGFYNQPDGLALTVDQNDGILIGGAFWNSADLGDGHFLSAPGNADIFLVEVDPLGEILRATSFGDPALQTVSALATDPSGDIWLAGNFSQTITLDPLPTQSDPAMDPSNWKAYLARLDRDPTGVTAPEPVFLRTFIDAGWIYVGNLVVTIDGDVAIGGSVMGLAASQGIDFGDGNKVAPPGIHTDLGYYPDGYVAKYCSNGGLRWARRIGTTALEELVGITADDAGHVFATGTFGGKFDFGGGQALTPAGYDPVTLKIGPF